MFPVFSGSFPEQVYTTLNMFDANLSQKEIEETSKDFFKSEMKFDAVNKKRLVPNISK